MDLPTCPACGQSVLDDDAVECPFCGSPMKGGKPAAKPAAAKPAPKPPAPKPAGSKTAGKTSTATPPSEAKTTTAAAVKAPAKPKSDDPFDIETPTGEDAVPVSPKQTKGRSLEVKCPMCETVGFVPPSAAGKDARCCNRECKLPLFHIPAPKKVEAPPPPPPPRSNMLLFVAIASAVILFAGVGLYFAFLTPKAPERTGGVDLNAMFKNAPTEDAGQPTAEAPKPAVATGPTDAVILSETLRDLVRAAQDSRSHKANSRRLATVGANLAGDEKTAAEQFSYIKTSEPSDTEDDEIVPLVVTAWKQFNKKDAAGVKATTDTAVARAKKFERAGRYRSEASLNLATLLAAQGRNEEGWDVLSAGSAGFILDSLTTAIEVVRTEGSFDLDQDLIGRSVGDWDNPQAVGVTLMLMARGLSTEAQAWIKSAKDPATQGECAIAWGEAAARDLLAKKQPIQPIETFAQSLKVSEKARLLARLAARQLQAGDEAAAKALVTAAAAALAEIKPSPAPIVTSLKDLLGSPLPDPYPMRSAALAAADVGSVQAQLKMPDAWSTIQHGLEYISRNALDRTYAEAIRQRAESVAAIRQDLKLPRDDAARQRRSELRNLADRLVAATAAREQREADLFLAAIHAGLIKEAWGDIEKSPGLMSSGLASVALARAQAANQTELASSIQSALQSPALTEIVYREASRLKVDAGVVPDAREMMGVTTHGIFSEWRLRLICRALKHKTKPVDNAVTMLGQLSKDSSFQIDSLRLSAALATKLGLRDEFKKGAAGRFKAQPPQLAGLYEGIIEGMARTTGK